MRGRVLTRQACTNSAAGHASLKALAVLFETHGLAAAAAVLMSDASDGREGARHHGCGCRAVFGVEGIRVPLED
jgi:hypothetical protein